MRQTTRDTLQAKLPLVDDIADTNGYKHSPQKFSCLLGCLGFAESPPKTFHSVARGLQLISAQLAT
eukprot:3733307-Amphidinium_carterae.1